MGDEEMTFTVVNGMVDLESLGAIYHQPDTDDADTTPDNVVQDEHGNIMLQLTQEQVNEHQLHHQVNEQHHHHQEEEEEEHPDGDTTEGGMEGEAFLTTMSAEDIGLDVGQILTIDGKQVFVVTPDGKLAAVTADCLESAGISITGGDGTGQQNIFITSNEEQEQEEETEEPATKQIKMEEETQEENGVTEDQQAAEGLIFGIYNNPNMTAVTSDTGLIHLTPEPADVTSSQQPQSSAVASSSSMGRTPLDEDADPTQAWFTTKDDKQTLTTRGHSWKQGQWSKDEVDVLQHNINAYCADHNVSDPTEIIFEMSKDERKDFYRTVARGLKRPLFSVYRRVIRMYDQKNHIGKYTQEEITRLRELRTIHGNDWAKIGAAMGRSASSVKDKCRLMRDMCNSGKWLPEEEGRLAKAVCELSGTQPGENVTSGLSWASVSERVVTRSEKQCRTKWLNYLNWKQQNGSEWTRMDDIRLMDRIAETGVADETDVDWNELTENWSSVRSPQWLRGKWWTLKRHIADYQILPFQKLVEQARSFHTISLRASLPGGSTTKPRTPKPPQLQQQHTQQTILDPATLLVVSMPDSNNHLLTTSASDTVTGVHETFEGHVVATSEGDGGLIRYEVLPQGFGAGTTFITTQVEGDPGGSGDHIILHTLPIASTHHSSVQGETAEISVSSAGNSIEHYVIEEALDTGTGEEEEETEEDPLQHMQLTTDDPDPNQLGPGQIDVDHIGDHIGEEVINLAREMEDSTTHTYIHTVHEEEEPTVIDDLHTSVQPTFTRSNSNEGVLNQMSSLSDPMLPSDTTDLMTENS